MRNKSIIRRTGENLMLLIYHQQGVGTFAISKDYYLCMRVLVCTYTIERRSVYTVHLKTITNLVLLIRFHSVREGSLC